MNETVTFIRKGKIIVELPKHKKNCIFRGPNAHFSSNALIYNLVIKQQYGD